MTERSSAPASSRGRKRAYRMRSRATSAAATGERVRAAATGLFLEQSYDEVSLAAVAESAGVSLPTVLRKFGTKDALFLECARAFGEREWQVRETPAGDVRGAARTLAQRYEQMMPFWKRYLDLEGRFPSVARVIANARQGHLAWLSTVFAPFLARQPGPIRTRQLATLFGATEIYLWWSWRTHLGLSASESEQVLVELLETLVERWRPNHGKERSE
jgi:AcrR family transcriptional regulator